GPHHGDAVLPGGASLPALFGAAVARQRRHAALLPAGVAALRTRGPAHQLAHGGPNVPISFTTKRTKNTKSTKDSNCCLCHQAFVSLCLGGKTLLVLRPSLLVQNQGTSSGLTDQYLVSDSHRG